MSAGTALASDPFETVTLDEETELRAFTRALELAQGFSLIFARCNQPVQRQRIISDLRSRLPHLDIQEISLREPIPHLLDELRSRFPEPPTGPIFVSGLEYSMPVAAEAYATPFVANLNAARNSFPHVLHSPLVLWVPEYVLAAIMRGAPDFFSVRSGVYYFAATTQEVANLAEEQAAGQELQAANLSPTEKEERLAIIQSILEDYQALPLSQRNRDAESRLLSRQGIILVTLGRFMEAEKSFVHCLAITQELGDRVGEGRILNNIGGIYLTQHQLAKAEAAFQKSLTIKQEAGSHISEASSLINLATIYRLKRQWIQAENTYKQGLRIAETLADQMNISGAVSGLGTLYLEQGRLNEAEIAFQQSLIHHEQLNDVFGQASILNNLGIVYQLQGRWSEAKGCFERTLSIDQQFGNKQGEGRCLQILASLEASYGDLHGAIDLERKALLVFREINNTVAQQEAQLLIAQWEAQIASRPSDHHHYIPT